MQNAEQIFQQAGLKSTVSRLEVTQALARANSPLTHQELLKHLPNSFDRVTLYRVLDWLLQHHVIHRIATEDRAWRFQLNAVSQLNKTKYSAKTTPTKQNAFKQHEHAHFQCSACGKVFCLENVYPKLTQNIPTDFAIHSIELNIKGKCANCQK